MTSCAVCGWHPLTSVIVTTSCSNIDKEVTKNEMSEMQAQMDGESQKA